MKEVEINGGVALELAADDRVIGPLDFDEISDALTPVFLGDLQGVVGCACHDAQPVPGIRG